MLPPNARKPVILSEGGLDDNGDPGTGGFRGKLSCSDYLYLLKVWDQYLMQEPQVYAGTVYTWGDGGWPSFEIDPIARDLLGYVQSQGGGVPIEWTVPVDPPADTPIYDLSADKSTIKAGESVRVSWYIEHVKAAWLDNQPITGPRGFRDFVLTATHNFVLDVDLLDGQEARRLLAVAVEAAPPATEPADPHLRAFPRPPNDNGRGHHFDPDVRDSNLAFYLPLLEALGIKWLLFFVGDELQAGKCARAAWSRGIMPIIRPQALINGGIPNWAGCVKAVLDAGVPGAYIQAYNEPGNEREWKNHIVPRDYREQWAGRWRGAARAIVAAGGLPGLQTCDKEDILAALTGWDSSVADKVWFASHAPGSNHPPDYPYNEGRDVWHNSRGDDVEDNCVLKFILDAAWVKQALGFSPPLIVTEGGYAREQSEDPTYPRIDAALQQRYSVAVYEWFRTGKLSNGDPLPDWLFAFCPFVFSGVDWQGFRWMDPEGVERVPQTIAAVKALAPFVRTFGGTVPEPDDPTALDEAIAEVESALNSADNLATALQIALDKLRSLK
jgi:hypothetical protein